MLALLAFIPAGAAAAWHDAQSQFRRAVRIDVDPQKITGEELANVKFLAAGERQSEGKDVHVTTAQGKPVSYRVINTGPGDQVDVAFNAQAGITDYLVYYGSAKPAEDAPAGQLNRGGLLMELKAGRSQLPSSGAELQSEFARPGRIIGRRLIPRPYLGNNLAGTMEPSLTRLSGKLFVPVDGPYVLAVAANDRGALFIDKKLVVFCRTAVADTRFQERVALTRGWHDFEFLHADGGGEYLFTVAWKRPDMDQFDAIGREFFGPVLQCVAGPLEQKDKPLTADMKATYLGEAFFASNYSHRYRFEAATALRNTDRLQVSWKFGDGQTATGLQVEHVYLTAGVYEVEVTSKLGANTDTQKFHLNVDRDYERASQPPTDEPGLHAKLAASYEVEKLAPETLAWAVLLQMRTGNLAESRRAAMSLARSPKHPNRLTAQKSIQELYDELIKQKQGGNARDIFAAVPAESDLQPWAAIEQAKILMYSLADFSAAEKAIARFAGKDDAARSTHGQALVLAGRFEQGRKLLESISIGASRQKAAAISGAMARTTEFYVEEKDAAGGEEAWEKWMATFPADFLDGNAAFMRVRLIDLRGEPATAAKVAEAYANANPQSAYAPRLLDTASKLLEKSDAAKSSQLRQLLKERYPEDPLSQK